MVRNGQGKEFGPYTKDQVLNFYKQNKIKANTHLRLVDGNGVSTVQDLIHQKEVDDNKTGVLRLEKLRQMREQIEEDKKAEKERQEQEKVKEEFKQELKEEKFEEFKFNKEAEEEEELDYEEIDNQIVEDNLDKTVIRRAVSEADVEKTILVNPKEELSEKTSAELDQMLEGSGTFTIEGEDEDKTQSISVDEATKMLTGVGIDAGIKLEAKNAEREVQEEINKYQRELDERANEFAEDEEEEEYEEEEEANTKKKIGPIFAILFIAVAYMFMTDEDEKKFIPPKYLDVYSPPIQKVADEVKSAQFYDQAVMLYLKGTYKSKLAAINALRGAVSFDAANEKATDLLIYLYAELLENSKTRQQDNRELFAMIKQNRSRVNKSPYLNAGTALFFLKIGNPQAAYNTAWNYVNLFYAEKLDAEKNKVAFSRQQSPLVWGIYLETQIEMNLINDPETIKNFNKLRNVNPKRLELYRALFKYLKVNDESQKDYFELLSQARKEYPGSVYLLMLYTDFLFQHGDLQNAKSDEESRQQFTAYRKALDEMSFLNFEGSPYYYARLLEHKGMAFGLMGKQQKAIFYIKKSLKVLENRELRRKLALFELMEKDSKGTEKIVNSIINESKVINAVDESQAALKNGKYEKAILKAVQATSVLPNDNRARLNLARVQLARGYFELALKTLEEIAEDNPLSLDIQVELVKAYIKAKKLKKAELYINKLIKMDKADFTLTWQYPSLVGRIYHAKGKLGLAINKIKDSTKRNPLNADDLFLLSQIFLDFRKYKRCKYYLSLALELDPNNVDYHITYAKTIYELQDANTAIGYLKRRLDKDPENTRIMGAIANYYYLNGSNKEFEMYKNKIKLSKNQDKYIYSFLVKASITEEKWEDVIEYAKKLIIIDPSDLEAYMVLGEKLYERSRFEEAMDVFDQVEKRMSTYQRLHYYKAKILVAQKKYQEAIDQAQKEIDANPESSAGYVAQGLGYIKLERYPEAIGNLKKAIARDGKDIEALMLLADVRYQQDLFDESRELYLRVKKYDPNNDILYRQLGHIYRKIGQPGLAIESYRVYLDQNPAARDRSQIESIIQVLQ